MSDHDTNPPDPETFDSSLVSGLLRVAFEPARRPVDHLIERLQQDDADAWLEHAVTDGPEHWKSVLLEDGIGLDELKRLKDLSKTRFADAADADERLRGLLQYLLVVSYGLAHHGVLLSSQSRGEISAVLLELALSLTDPWRDFVAEAAMTPSTRS